jgi:hypothetical protein
VLTDLNNNQNPVSDMVAYQAMCLDELNDLQQENQQLMASLQGNSSPATWTIVSGNVQTNLLKMQDILNQEFTLQTKEADKANNNANGFNGVAPTPAPASAPAPTPTPAPKASIASSARPP